MINSNTNVNGGAENPAKDDVKTTGMITSNGQGALIGGVGLVIGILFGAGGMAIIRKKEITKQHNKRKHKTTVEHSAVVFCPINSDLLR